MRKEDEKKEGRMEIKERKDTKEDKLRRKKRRKVALSKRGEKKM